MNGILALKAIALVMAGFVAGTLPSTSLMADDSPDGPPHPANKTSIAGSSFEVLSAPVVEGATSEEKTILSTSIKTSSPTDLVMSVTLECALWTDVTVVGNEDSSAIATVRVWIEMDGSPVPVSSDEDPAADGLGQVVFCNRAYRFTVTNLDDEDARFDQFLRTRTSNAFHWITLDVGSATHAIEVKAQLEAEVTGTGFAQAGIGKRTLVVEPMMLANDAII